MYKVLYLDEVENDIAIAKQWYAEQQKELDVRFAAAVKETLSNILEMPSVYAVRYRNIRIAHTKIFPYNVHFYIDEAKAQVVIIGIVHNKRNNALFLDR
ncbi:MAG: type II toxin-antitoxin system RelE/ParE family toxin [Candidatus Azobacteroides sp.]|nr:type II toxin-antitoxin system RelE/ParE family toxin [Candidatus Azobacteroides sp.]